MWQGGVGWQISLPHHPSTPPPQVTWTLAVSASIPLQYGFAIDCIDGQCWTCLLDVLTQESSIAALN